jgi:hypothetical protein
MPSNVQVADDQRNNVNGVSQSEWQDRRRLEWSQIREGVPSHAYPWSGQAMRVIASPFQLKVRRCLPKKNASKMRGRRRRRR